jgi:hypothetical protein
MHHLAIVVEGGVVREIYANDPVAIKVTVLDLDIEGCEAPQNGIANVQMFPVEAFSGIHKDLLSAYCNYHWEHSKDANN